MVVDQRLCLVSLGSFCVGGVIAAVVLRWRSLDDDNSKTTKEEEESFYPTSSWRLVLPEVESSMTLCGVDEEEKIDLLVHNVSHSDVVISFGDPEESEDKFDDDAKLLALPRFSKFAATCEELLSAATPRVAFARSGRRELNRREYPVLKYEEDDDDDDDPRQDALPGPGKEEEEEEEALPAGKKKEQRPLPKRLSSSELRGGVAAGIRLAPTTPHWTAARLRSDLKVRRTEVRRLFSAAQRKKDPDEKDDEGVPRRVYFPLLAVCVNQWLEDVCEPGSTRVVLLVTGAGSPRDESHHQSHHQKEGGKAEDPFVGNSTENASKLMELFLRSHYDDDLGDVVLLHSESNIFRYDENISFVRHELLPAVAKIRNRVVDERGSLNWAPRFKMALTSCDGAPARVATIQRSLRVYKPTSVHVWQPKTFWQHRVLSRDDVEILPFAVTETVPPMPSTQAEGDVKRVVEETRRLKDDFYAKIVTKPNDMANFWHRKSRKVVVAVLLVRKNPRDEGTLYHGVNMEVSMPTGSLCAERNAIGAALTDDLGLMRSSLKLISVLGLDLPPRVLALDNLEGASETSPRPPTSSSFGETRRNHHPDAPSTAGGGGGGERRRQVIQSYPKISKDHRTTLASTSRSYSVTKEDMNPLRPCGACAEWLKKIASVNPDFSVVTFTDADCQGFFVESAVLD